jgi:hypothetical protein
MENGGFVFFEEGKRGGAGGKGDEENVMWKPFITVPESLSSRGSGMMVMEPVQPHATV